MVKPKGGKKAPYPTQQMRIPVSLELQVQKLCGKRSYAAGNRYREFVESGGNPDAPPSMLESASRSQLIEEVASLTFEAIGTVGEDWPMRLDEFLEELARAIATIKQQTEPEPEPEPEPVPETKPEPEPVPETEPARPRSKHEKIWDELNERQQTYLKQIFEIDQDREASERGAWNRGGKPRPADEWRWIEYLELFGNSSPLRQKLKRAKVVDPGTGSTFKALRTRKLIEIDYCYPEQDCFNCKLTRLGRAVVRAGLGVQSEKKLPPRTLRDYQWKALVSAWNAGDDGLTADGERSGDYGGHSWRYCWVRLRNWNDRYGRSGLVWEFRKDLKSCLGITEEGRKFYRENWQKYRELYPEVEAPEPD
ncbi:hypothetical protein [Laspinema olomoucense]|uniref:hypothetical protein n=1 Tax=Laspinema olomoucense TaxID=3231600 RepID=UPI0021BB3BCF|nr:hypothetical protein [Laspinema sp. D3a]MCT7991909.1 hypothetical protein [Laspinema sp. D3a]